MASTTPSLQVNKQPSSDSVREEYFWSLVSHLLWKIILYLVQPGHLGVIYSRIGGLDNKSNLREGLNFVVPWFQRPIIFDIRTRPQVSRFETVLWSRRVVRLTIFLQLFWLPIVQLINTQSGSKDLQMIQISIRVLFKPNPQELPFIYRRLGKGMFLFIDTSTWHKHYS